MLDTLMSLNGYFTKTSDFETKILSGFANCTLSNPPLVSSSTYLMRAYIAPEAF
jgi:hypothetical protein